VFLNCYSYKSFQNYQSSKILYVVRCIITGTSPTAHAYSMKSFPTTSFDYKKQRTLRASGFINVNHNLLIITFTQPCSLTFSVAQCLCLEIDMWCVPFEVRPTILHVIQIIFTCERVKYHLRRRLSKFFHQLMHNCIVLKTILGLH
jgi:hypothetical protein